MMSDQIDQLDEEEEVINQVRRRFPGVCGFKGDGSFYLDVLQAKMRVNANGQPVKSGQEASSLGPTFEWQSGKSSLLIFWNRIVLSFGNRTALTLDEEGITFSVGDTLLRISESGITTVGNMVTEGVHTDNNGTHGGEGGGVRP